MTAATPSSRPPVWRDVRVLRWTGQLVVVAVTAGLLWWLFSNAVANLQQARLPTGYGFLSQPYGVDIPGSDFRPGQSVWDAYLVGYGNTIRLIAFGIPACTVIGIVIGIARLSENLLVRGFGTLYVETFRNIPILLWILLAFGPLLTQSIPPITEALEPLGLAVFSNRGLYVPWLGAEVGIATILAIVAFALLAGTLVAAWRRRVSDRTGEPARDVLFGVLVILAVVVVGWFVSGATVVEPDVEGRLVTGGINVFVNYAALALALTLYTASHVAEIVRGAIQAVHHGQSEAANALALSSYQRYRFVVLPQAFRIMIPPLANQYLNLTKNSSLAVAVGYFEITRVTQTVANNAAPALQAITILMGLYLTFSLGISLVANLINRRLQLEGRS